MTINLTDSLIYSVIGMAVVFGVLCILFFIIALQGKLFQKEKKVSEAAPAAVAAPVFSPAGAKDDGVLLIDVDDKTAAMIMAIVADSTGIPAERLHFKSIKSL